MYKTLNEAMQDPKFNSCNIKIMLDADQIDELEWKETTDEGLKYLEADIDFVPARMYPRGFWHEGGEVGHDMQHRYFIPQKQ